MDLDLEADYFQNLISSCSSMSTDTSLEKNVHKDPIISFYVNFLTYRYKRQTNKCLVQYNLVDGGSKQHTQVAARLSVNSTEHINEVTLRQARLVQGWVTVSGFNSRCRTFISVCGQVTQPGHPFVDRCNEYQAKGSEALQLRSKGRYGSCVGGR